MSSFPERVGPRTLSLESVDYFGTSEYFSGREKEESLRANLRWWGVGNFHCMQMSLVMVMRFISGYDWNDKPYSSRFCSVISLESRPLILVYLYARTETIQKQMVQYDIKLKGKYPGKYSTVDKEGPDKLLARKSCFVHN